MPTTMNKQQATQAAERSILITGATGYVGARLLRALENQSRQIRCLARRPEMLAGRTGANTEIVPGDVLDPDSLARALEGVDTALYLIHSMGSAGSFEQVDRQAARNFASAAAQAGVRRIIYLGGLGDCQQPLSAHLRSRHEVGEVLRGTGVQVIEFRASIVIGSGSLSFEMVRALVERLPIMIAPRWVSVLSQPIAVSDLLSYLVAAVDLDISDSRVFEIGGADRVSYGDLMREYARQRGLRRLIIPVPVLTPRLSSLWLGLVTPLYARVGRKLIDSICFPTVVRDPLAGALFDIAPVGYRDAIQAALGNENQGIAESRWSDALSAGGTAVLPANGVAGSRLFDSRCVQTPCAAQQVFDAVQRIGGRTGWYFTNWLWDLRGWVDLAIGGIGMRRGRPHPERLRVGDTVDCWRVEALEPGRRLRLAAEMKLPGRAWLEFEVTGNNQFSVLRQTAIFDPQGLAGRAYWYLVYPLHQLVFAGMLRGIAAASRSAGPGAPNAFRPSRFMQACMFLVFLVVCFGTAAIGTHWTFSSVNGWYQTLARPAWTPPDWVFGPVWSVLYFLMALAAWLVWRSSRATGARAAWLAFGFQLALNAAWSGIFFALRSPGAAFGEILLLWAAIGATALTFRGHNKLAGWLLVPYLAWSSFAAVLNLAIWRLNP
jgi:tryptophan-rich sensory protein/uncharacterized protein YbjT (DUF2867 family)